MLHATWHDLETLKDLLHHFAHPSWIHEDRENPKQVGVAHARQENSRHPAGCWYWQWRQIDGISPHHVLLQNWQCFSIWNTTPVQLKVIHFRTTLHRHPITRTSQDIGQNWKTQTGYFTFGSEKRDKTMHRKIVSTWDDTGYNCPRSDFSILVHRCK